jgi:hypothetical protein
MSKLISRFILFSQQIRLYHWGTKSYARHVASGSLYEKIDGMVDRFVETLQGKLDDRRISYDNIKLKLKNYKDDEIENVLVHFKEFLVNDVETYLDEMNMSNTDLKNIRDEMLGLVNQSLYLFSLK